MSHRDFEDNDDFDEDKIENYGEELDAEETIRQYERIKQTEIDLTLRSLKSELLDKAIFIAKGSWSWWFISSNKKIERVKFIYKNLNYLVE